MNTSLILIIEHRNCACGRTYTAPNPKPLSRWELAHYSNAQILLPCETLTDARNASNSYNEIIHLNIPIEACEKCFHLIRQPPSAILSQVKPIEKAKFKNNYSLDNF